MTWNLACPDWADRLRAGKPPIPDLPLFREPAERAVTVFDRLRLPDVPGTPLLGSAAGGWFREGVVRPLHGSLAPVTGERHIRELFVLVPKKNSKTTYSALLMLASLLVNQRPKGLFLLVAPTIDVSTIAFSAIEGAIRLDPELSAMLHVQNHLKRVTDLRTGATLQIMSWDPSTLTGQKCAGVLLDETHVIASSSKSASCLVQLRGSLTAYPEAFMVQISTQSEVPPSGVFRSELMRARAIRDGRQTGKMLPVIFEFPPDIAADRGKWGDPKNWPMVLPNLGRSVVLDRLIDDFNTVREGDESELRRWASQFLNVEIGLGLVSDRWAGADYWEAAGDHNLTLDQIIERSDAIAVAVDGGGLDDLLAVAVIGRDRDTRKWLSWCMAWAHTDVLERRRSEVGRLRDFEKDGDLRIIDTLPQYIEEVAKLIAWLDSTGLLVGIGLDQIGVGGIVEALAAVGIEKDRITPIAQGFRLNGAILTVERKLADKTLAHCVQRIMTWCVGNTKVELRGKSFSLCIR